MGLLLFLAAWVVFAGKPDTGDFCSEYQQQTQLQRQSLQDWCGASKDTILMDSLFPEFMWCQNKGSEANPDCFANTERHWCEAVETPQAEKLLQLRTHEIEQCQAVYRQAFGVSGRTLAELLPAGYALVGGGAEKSDLQAIEHDFNADGVVDFVFVISKQASDGQLLADNLRLMVALSQKDGTLRTLPVAPYSPLRNFEPESVEGHSVLERWGEEGFRLINVMMDNNNWDQRSEHRFRFIGGDFRLEWSSSGYTQISYDEAQPSENTSSVRDYARGVKFKSDTQRCDFLEEANPCPEIKRETIPADLSKPVLANFSMLEERVAR